MTSQEWILLALALPATLGALYCLRRRPEFGAIQRNDDVSERESLEVGAVGLGFSGGGDMHTQSIVESVIGHEEKLDQNVVSAALGEMGVIAEANAAEAAEQEELKAESDMIHDSRYTTTILDEDTLDMVSTYANEEEEVEEVEEDDTGWSVWEPELESEHQPEPETDSKVERQLPEIPELFREPILDTPDPLDVPSIPEIPSIEAPANLGERISSMASQAADVTVNVTKEVVSATVSGAKEVASIAAGFTEKVVEKVRQKSTKGVMPVRPTGLPPMAEWDAYQGAWTLMGRPVQVAAMPEPETQSPDWSRTQSESTVSQNEPLVQTNDVGRSNRNTPFIPELP